MGGWGVLALGNGESDVAVVVTVVVAMLSVGTGAGLDDAMVHPVSVSTDTASAVTAGSLIVISI
jgi:hypothetical protein